MYRNGSICFVSFRIPRTLMDGLRLYCRKFVENSSKFVIVRPGNNSFQRTTLFLKSKEIFEAAWRKSARQQAGPKSAKYRLTSGHQGHYQEANTKWFFMIPDPLVQGTDPYPSIIKQK